MNPWPRRLVLILVLVVVTNLPHIVGLLRQTGGQQYLGTILSNPADSSPYFSLIEQARQGRWLFSNQFTSETQQPSLIHPLWLITGWLEAVFRSNAAVAFHIVRTLAIVVMVIALDVFIAQWFSDARRRTIAMWVMTTSSGIGWMFAGQVHTSATITAAPIDLWVDEANTFRTMGHSAQFILAQVLLLGILWAVWQVTQGQRKKWHRWIGPSILLLGCIHPYDLLTVGMVSGAWTVGWLVTRRQRTRVDWLAVRTIAGWWLWVLPVVGYYILGPLRQVAMTGWLEQNITLSPTPPALLVGYGALVPLTVIGWRQARAKNTSGAMFILCWIAAVIVTMYVPGLTVQRRMLGGLHIPISILATFGLLRVIEVVSTKRLRRAFTAACVVMLAITNIQLLKSQIIDVSTPEAQVFAIYANADLVGACAWLRAHSTMDDVVLGSFTTSNTLVSLTGRTVAYGQMSQTVDFFARQEDWRRFIDRQTSTAERESLVRRLRVGWLYWTPDDQVIGGYTPDEDPMWTVVYRGKTDTLYRLKLQ